MVLLVFYSLLKVQDIQWLLNILMDSTSSLQVQEHIIQEQIKFINPTQTFLCHQNTQHLIKRKIQVQELIITSQQYWELHQ